MIRLLIAVVLTASFGLIDGATAQLSPSRPITMIVPYPAGGGMDALARVLAESLKASLGQTVVVENISGAGGTIAMTRLARAQPDGYTLGIGTSDQVVNASIYPVSYDPLKDFEPVGMLATSPYLIATKNAVPAKDLKELIVWLKENHHKVSQGHNGIGSGQHLCGIDLQNHIGTRWQFVAYRGAAPALQDLVGGQIDLLCPLPAGALAMVRAGRIRAYAVASQTPLASAPEIPTVDEAGLPGLYNSAWGSLLAPKGTPKDAIAKLNSAVVNALADPTVRGRIADIGMEIPPRIQLTPEALAALQKAEAEKWWPVVKAAGIKAQ